MHPLLAVPLAAVAAFVAEIFVSTVIHRSARRSALAAHVARGARPPLRLLLVVAASWGALTATTGPTGFWAALGLVLHLGVVVAVTWLVGALVLALADHALAGQPNDVPAAGRLRGRAQRLVRTVTASVLSVGGLVAVLLALPGTRALGVGVLVLVGLVLLVAVPSAQGALGEVVAGLRVVATDAVLPGDVVVVDGRWGLVERVGRTSLVVRTDEAGRIGLPLTATRTTGFRNVSREGADLVGTVELDLDRDLPAADVRARVAGALATCDLWDGRVGDVQVVDVHGDHVRVQVLLSASDGPALLGLRRQVRDTLLGWSQPAAARPAEPAAEPPVVAAPAEPVRSSAVPVRSADVPAVPVRSVPVPAWHHDADATATYRVDDLVTEPEPGWDATAPRPVESWAAVTADLPGREPAAAPRADLGSPDQTQVLAPLPQIARRSGRREMRDF
ncbi:hypothetical protein ACGIF2_08830 [Cellulomonas sp. P22]|uniref:hypothetical protein n=1 Tax=Cellulomonas sp. P22 TaxID=3373189 RepID=UPI0037B9F8ED